LIGEVAGRLYLECAGLLTLGFVVLWALRRAWLWNGGAGSARAWLRSAQAVLVAGLVLPPATRALPDALFPASVFSRSPGSGLAPASGAPRARGDLGGREGDPSALVPPSVFAAALPRHASWGVAVAAAVALAFGLQRYRSLRKHLGGLPVMRRSGRVWICVSDAAGIPYSARTLRRAFVVVPTDSLADWARLRLFVAHELQHHRQGDTMWVHGLAAVRTAFAWLPAAYGWNRLLSELQEIACDEAVLRRRPAIAPRYAQAILRAATGVRGRLLVPAGTTAAAGSHGRVIRRRIEMILRRPTTRRPGPARLGLACLALVGTAAFLARAEDTPVRTTAQGGVVADTKPLDIALPDNDLVRVELNRIRTDPRRRASLQAGLQRMDEHRALIEGALERHGLPRALIVVPLIESAFENLDAASPRMASQAPGARGAGIWMFIPQTAQAYGLRVDASQDERLDVERSTEAAASYLGKLYGAFGDWPLALAAYNQGESAVRAAIRRGNTRDAWALQRQGLLNGYASTFMAAARVLDDPSLLQ
jgi:membrane-bound lytic murein transglycosylase D